MYITQNNQNIIHCQLWGVYWRSGIIMCSGATLIFIITSIGKSAGRGLPSLTRYTVTCQNQRIPDHPLLISRAMPIPISSKSSINERFAFSWGLHEQTWYKCSLDTHRTIDSTHTRTFQYSVCIRYCADINHPKLFETLGNHIVEVDSLDRFKAQVLSNTVWSYATVQVSYPKLFQSVAAVAIQRKDLFNSQAVANNLLLACATSIDKQLLILNHLCRLQRNRLTLTTIKVLLILFHGRMLAVADVDAPNLFNKDFVKCIEEKDGFDIQHLFQLYQWILWQTKEKSNDAGLPQDLLDKSYVTFISTDPTISNLQDKRSSSIIIFYRPQPKGRNTHEQWLSHRRPRGGEWKDCRRWSRRPITICWQREIPLGQHNSEEETSSSNRWGRARICAILERG